MPKLKCGALCNGPIFSFSSCYCYFANFKPFCRVTFSFRDSVQKKKKKMMSSHWKLFLFPCHKVWAHFGMALWFISLTSSAGSAQTPREIQALPPLVPGKVDFRSPSLKKKTRRRSWFSKTLGYTVGTMSWKILLHYWVAKPRRRTCQFSKQRGAVWIRRYSKSALLIVGSCMNRNRLLHSKLTISQSRFFSNTSEKYFIQRTNRCGESLSPPTPPFFFLFLSRNQTFKTQ